jgi:hypothetical protein
MDKHKKQNKNARKLQMLVKKKANKTKQSKLHFFRVRLKQRIHSPLFERHFRRISVLCVTSRRGTVGCYDTLAERYGECIRCFTLTHFFLIFKL